jgi:hypothetical protein
MTHDEMIAVIQAHKDGKKIQVKGKGVTEWTPSDLPVWNFYMCDYRVKPEPMELWAIIWPSGAMNYFDSRGQAVACANTNIEPSRIVHLREVEDEK